MCQEIKYLFLYMFFDMMASFKWFLRFRRNCATWPAINRPTIVPQETYNCFRNSLPKILNDCLAKTEYLESSYVKNRIQKMVAYHTLERVQGLGQLTIFAYLALEDSKNITDDMIHQINVLAWCVEMVFSYYLITDDIEDGAATRYGKPCWHMLPNVGTMSLNDSSMMRSFIHELLRQNLCDNVYAKITKLFNETFFRCNYGQYLDSISAKIKNFSKFDMNLYRDVSNSKFTFANAKFPILVALTMCNKINKEHIQNIDISLKNVGVWIQMHNDIMDWCDEMTTGKSNTDIKKGKLSWLAVAALQRCDLAQREVFLSHYGRNKPKNIKRILQLYNDLELRDVFCKEHSECLDNISQQINSLPHNSSPPAEFFHNYVKNLYPFVVCYPEALEFDRQARRQIWGSFK